MRDRDKIEKLMPYEEEKYENVDLDHLVMYVMAQLEKVGADLSFENAAVAAFKLFPRKFSLLGYTDYPDSNRVHKCLWRCTSRSKQWLGGRVRQGFKITERSHLLIKETEALLSGISSKETRATSQTRRKETLLAEAESSPAYKKYIQGERDSVTEADFCFLLQGTLDSARETLRENLNTLKVFAEELARADFLKFLNWLEERFRKLLSGE